MNEYSIRTNKLELTVAAAPLRLTRVLLRAHPERCGALSAELFRVTLDGVRYDASSFRVTSADERDDGRYRLLRIELAHDCGVSAALSFLADTDDSIELILSSGTLRAGTRGSPDWPSRFCPTAACSG